MTDETDNMEWGIDRRTVLKSAGAFSATGIIGVPALSGTALAAEHEMAPDFACKLDIMCAIDASGSLDGEDVDLIQVGVNAFIDELEAQAGDKVRVGSLQFAGGEISRLNGLQLPSKLSVTVDDPGGDTPMPAALDIADQVLYTDDGKRDDADKLIVVFTDGGPNYERGYNENLVYEATINGTKYTAPRDDKTTWSAETDPGYDRPDGGVANVSEGEMTETAGVASSIKGGSAGSGETAIAAIYTDLANDVTNAMTSEAETEYTDLPTYLEEDISSPGLFLEGDTAEEIAGLGEELAAILEENCCTECPDGFYYKFEWVEDEEAESECKGEFVIYDDEDKVVESVEGVELDSVTCDEDGEPQKACFETTVCELESEVKAGRETKSETVLIDDNDGTFCVTGIEDTNPGGQTVTYAISHIVFSCPGETDEKTETGRGKGRGK